MVSAESDSAVVPEAPKKAVPVGTVVAVPVGAGVEVGGAGTAEPGGILRHGRLERRHRQGCRCQRRRRQKRPAQPRFLPQCPNQHLSALTTSA